MRNRGHGLPDIDSHSLRMRKLYIYILVQDLKDNTEYINYSRYSRVIGWLWDILSNFDISDKAAFLQFVTGIYYKEIYMKLIYICRHF